MRPVRLHPTEGRLWGGSVAAAAIGGVMMMNSAATASSLDVELYVDSAPNVYGSPDYAQWWDDAKQDAIDGSFTNLSNGTFPGTDTIHPEDFIATSFGDLGKRIHWVFKIEGETLDSLDGRFEVKFAVDWAGTEYTYDWDDGLTIPNDPDDGWVQPSSWEEYNTGDSSGVIGSFGFAWAAHDSEQYDQLVSDIFENQTMLRGLTRFRADEFSEWELGESIELSVIPLPAPVFMGLAGLAGVAVLRRRSVAKQQSA